MIQIQKCLKTKEKSNEVKVGKDSIPDCHSFLNLLNVIADNLVLDVVEHADTQ